MTAWIRQRNLGWLPTVVVLVVVLIAGSRLMYLSVQHHAAGLARRRPRSRPPTSSKIEPQLQKLADSSEPQAAAAAQALVEYRHVHVARIGAAGAQHLLDDDR